MPYPVQYPNIKILLEEAEEDYQNEQRRFLAERLRLITNGKDIVLCFNQQSLEDMKHLAQPDTQLAIA